MALTKIGKEGITGISNSANANAITIDSGENVALSGTLGVTGAATLSSTAGIAGNATVGGTLGVTGAITGTLATAAQTNITSVGTLTSFRSTGIDDNADALAITIDNSEKVGIGTTSPQDELHVYLNSGQRVARFEANNTTSAHISFKGSNTSLMPTIGVKDEDLYLSTGDAVERMRINASGNVGIGTSSPYTLLELSSTDPILRFNDSNGGTDTKNFEIRYVGTSSPDIDGLYFRTVNDANSVYSDKMVVLGSGNVGIGYASSGTKLHIRSSVASSIAGYRDGTTGLIVEGDAASYIQIIASKTNPMGILFDGGNTHNDTSRGAMLYDIDYGLAFKSGGAVRWKIDEAGDIIPYSTSSGIVLGATSNVDANTLDDYEEGTFTATPWGGGVISSQMCRYIKVGNFVSFIARIIYGTTNNGDASGFQGLPFTVGSTDAYRGGTVSYSTYGSSHYALVANGATRVIFYNLSGSTLLNSHFSTKQVFVSGHYYV